MPAAILVGCLALAQGFRVPLVPPRFLEHTVDVDYHLRRLKQASPDVGWLVLMFPALRNLHGYAFGYEHDRLTGPARDHGFVVRDLLDDFRPHPVAKLGVDHLHPSRFGNSVAGDAAIETLLRSGLIAPDERPGRSAPVSAPPRAPRRDTGARSPDIPLALGPATGGRPFAIVDSFAPGIPILHECGSERRMRRIRGGSEHDPLVFDGQERGVVIGTERVRAGGSFWAPLIIALAAVAGLVWSRGTWLDASVDFGRELYVPWRLSQGDVLYRDIASFNGPFSPYLIAAWFRVAGVSLQALVLLNAAILGATLALLYGMTARIADAYAARVACLTFIAMFAYGNLAPHGMLPMGNFNWIAPYSHELTHGIALALLALHCQYRFARGLHSGWLAGSGLILGVVFLTKAEAFAAAAAAASLGLGATLWLERVPGPRALRFATLFVAACAAPGALSVLLLWLGMPIGPAVLGTLGTWPYLLDTAHTRLPYFRWGMGIDDPAASLARILLWCLLYAALLMPLVAFACSGARLGRAARAAIAASLAAALLVAGLALGAIGWFDPATPLQWQDIAQPWQILLLGIGSAFAWPAWRRQVAPAERPAAALRLAAIVFALGLLLKMFLNVRVYHYGFALAAPAACIVVAFFTSWLPGWIDRQSGDGALVRCACLALWLVVAALHLSHANANVAAKDLVVGAGADSFRSEARGELVARAAAYLEDNAAPDDTLAAIPEGIMLNYLTRLPAPPPFVQYTPPLIELFGEDRMLAALDAAPPEWIALVHRDDSDYGVAPFGRGYGLELRAWIERRYRRAHQFGPAPFTDGRFGIVLLRRRE